MSGRSVLLLVDDEPNVCSALARLFRPRGFDVLVAHDAETALEKMDSRPVDIVITDMRMPGRSGVDLLQDVATRHPAAYRILLTGYANLADTKRARELGLVQHFMTKPWEIDEIERCVIEASKSRDDD